MRVAVVGAGIVGASVAFRLSQGGAEVVVLDRGQPASGTTSASFAWVNANNKTPREYFELNRVGMEEHFRLREELPSRASWLRRDGNLIQHGDDGLEELDGRVERLCAWGYAAEWWTASRVKKELEPRVALPDPDTPVAFFPEEGWADAPCLVELLLEHAARSGAETRPGAAIEAIERSAGRVSGVSVTGGERIPVDAVVNAAGPEADRVAALVGRELPLRPKDGLLARVATSTQLLGRLLHTSRVNLRPDGPGHVLLHHSSVDEQLPGGDGKVLAEELLRRAREVIPALGTASLWEVRIGTRPVPADGFSCVGGVTGVPGYYEAVTHSGVTLGPLLGRWLAREMLEGEVDPLLTTFRPDRF